MDGAQVRSGRPFVDDVGSDVKRSRARVLSPRKDPAASTCNVTRWFIDANAPGAHRRTLRDARCVGIASASATAACQLLK